MDLLKFFKDKMTPKTGVSIIEVEGEAFNPTLELVKLLKDKIADKASRIVDLEMELSQFRTEVASLRAKIDPAKLPDAPRTMHFYTTTALKAELERRSRLEKENYELAKSSDH